LPALDGQVSADHEIQAVIDHEVHDLVAVPARVHPHHDLMTL